MTFDVFDTALVRRAANPGQVFLWLAEQPFFKGLGVPAERLAALRMRAEQTARTKAQAKGGGLEVGLLAIHQELCDLLGIPLSLASEAVSAEEQVERELCFRNDPIHTLWQEARENGRRTLFISDTYHRSAFLAELLSAAGYEASPADVIASCEHGVSKRDGRLFERNAERIGLGRPGWLHVGDDPDADGTGAVRAGGEGWVHPWKGRDRRPLESGTLLHQRDEGWLYAVACSCRGQEDLWYRMGRETFGPLLLGFSLWIAGRLQSAGARQAWFLLRDGHLLSQAYERVRAHRPGLPPSRLLQASRRAFCVAALGCSDWDGLETLLISSGPKAAREFLTRLDLDPARCQAAFAESGFASPDEPVDHRGETTRVLRLLRHPLVLAALNQRGLVERKLLVRYLEQEGFLEDPDPYLIDLGWNGTLQRALLSVLREEKRTVCPVGLYLATFSGVQAPLLQNYRTAGYLCDRGEPALLARALGAFREFPETVCTAPTGSLRCFTRQSGRVEPKLDPPDHPPAQWDRIERIHRGALDCMEECLAAPHAPRAVAPETAAYGLLRLLQNPSPPEAAEIGRLVFGEGIGTIGHRSLGSLWEDREQATRSLERTP